MVYKTKTVPFINSKMGCYNEFTQKGKENFAGRREKICQKSSV